MRNRRIVLEALNPFKKSYHDVFYALKNIDVERSKKGEMIGLSVKMVLVNQRCSKSLQAF